MVLPSVILEQNYSLLDIPSRPLSNATLLFRISKTLIANNTGESHKLTAGAHFLSSFLAEFDKGYESFWFFYKGYL
jgi:hypothetical protein